MAKTRKQRGGVCPCALKMGGSRSSSNKMGGNKSSSKGGEQTGIFNKIGGFLVPFGRKLTRKIDKFLGGSSCSARNPLTALYGGYKPTRKNRKFLKKYKQGKSIGFTARASLKAKGLIPRSNGTYKVSAKYLRR